MKTLVRLHSLAWLAFACHGRSLFPWREHQREGDILHEHIQEELYARHAVAASQHPLPAMQNSESDRPFEEPKLSKSFSVFLRALTQAAAFKPSDFSETEDEVDEGAEVQRMKSIELPGKMMVYTIDQRNSHVKAMMEDSNVQEQGENGSHDPRHGKAPRKLHFSEFMEEINRLANDAKRVAILLLVGSTFLRLVGSTMRFIIYYRFKHDDGEHTEQTEIMLLPAPEPKTDPKPEQGKWDLDGDHVWALVKRPRRYGR